MLRYPSFVFTAIVAATMIVMVYVIPAFSGVYGAMHTDLPLATKILMGVSGAMSRNWTAILAVMALAAIGVRYYISTPEGEYRWDRVKLRLPIVGRILAKATIARFCRSFGMAMNSGVPIVTALALVSRVVDNAFYHERIMAMRDAVSHGDSLLRAFLASGVFSPIELQMISVGEETGDIETMVQQLAML